MSRARASREWPRGEKRKGSPRVAPPAAGGGKSLLRGEQVLGPHDMPAGPPPLLPSSRPPPPPRLSLPTSTTTTTTTGATTDHAIGITITRSFVHLHGTPSPDTSCPLCRPFLFYAAFLSRLLFLSSLVHSRLDSPTRVPATTSFLSSFDPGSDWTACRLFVSSLSPVRDVSMIPDQEELRFTALPLATCTPDPLIPFFSTLHPSVLLAATIIRTPVQSISLLFE